MNRSQDDMGAFGAVRARGVRLLALGYTRLELLGNELEGARDNAMRQLALLLGVLFSVMLGVVLTVATLVLLWWEQRLLVVALGSVLLWALALYFFVRMRSGPQHAEPLFAASLAELQEDLRQLKAATGHGQRTD